MDTKNLAIGFTGYHDGRDNFSCSAAENILCYETNIKLGHDKETAAACTLHKMTGSVTIQKYQNGQFKNHKITKCIESQKDKLAAIIKEHYGEGCILKMPDYKDMQMNDRWKEAAKYAKEHGFRKSMSKGSATTDIYLYDRNDKLLDTISMKIGSA